MEKVKLPPIKYPADIDVESLPAPTLINWLAEETIRLVKLLPVQAKLVDGVLLKRTIWRELCALVKLQDCNWSTQYPYEIVRRIVEKVVMATGTTQIIETIWEASELRQILTDTEALDVRWDQCQDTVYGEVMRKVIEYGKEAPVKVPYQEINALDFVINDPVFESVFSANGTWEWLDTDQDSGRIAFVDLTPQERCRQECREIFQAEKKENQSKRKGLAKRQQNDHLVLPSIIEKAIDLAETAEDYSGIVAFAKEMKVGITTIYDRYKPNWDLVVHADPALFFPFAQKPILGEQESRDFVDNVQVILNGLCPSREKPIAELLLSVIRRLTGDQDAVYPLLIGPPGTAKTYIVEQLADAFSKAGLKTNYVHQAMTGSVHRESNDVSMSLQGITSKWGNGRHGIIYTNVYQPENKLTLVALDEMDKCSLQDYMVSLLDPRQAFQDNYWRDFFSTIDMRPKVLFFGTANNVEKIRQGGQSPLWSRVAPIMMDGYTVSESIELVASLASQRKVHGRELGYREAEILSEKIVRKYARQSLPSIRALLDQVNREIHLRQYPSLKRILSEQREEYQPPQRIGFAAK